MKANELMIGDWVVIEAYSDDSNLKTGDVTVEQHYGRVTNVVRYAKDYEDVLVKTDNNVGGINEGYPNPVPLTKEMLFANGFKGNGCKGGLVHPDYKNLQVYYEIDHFEGEDWIVKEWGVMGICGIEYVHEFQHYLRLISKNDLADNFKLKED